MTETNWLTQQQACDHAKLSEATFLRWINKNFLVSGIHYGGSGKNRRYDQAMLDAAIRFQNDEASHQQAIEAKRQSLLTSSRRRG